MPVVYYGTESGFYNRVRIVSEVFICRVIILALVDVTKLQKPHYEIRALLLKPCSKCATLHI